MLWPTPADYVQAVGGYPDVCLLDPLLKGGKSKKNSTNQLLVYTGGFSTVFPIDIAHSKYALRCWNKDIGDSKNRYEKIDRYLKQVNLPYFVDFEYVQEGILINGKKWPITRMEWTDGDLLRAFVDQNLNDTGIFAIVADEFRKMFECLHVNQISHGDLQDGNILLTRNGKNITIKLIDYDSLFVPNLQGQKSPTPGLPEYQHPLRTDQCNEKMDYFSELVIYLSFLSLSERPELWDKFKDKTEKGLLFTKEDFKNPNQSEIFQELNKLSSEIRQLATTLKDYCGKTSIDQLHPLEDILPMPDVNSHTDSGFILLSNKQYTEALIEFQKAVSIDCNYKRAIYGFGLANLHTKRFTEAIVAFGYAISQDPDYKEAHYGLGLTHFKLGEINKANSAISDALRIDPHYQPAKQLLKTIKTSEVTSIHASTDANSTQEQDSTDQPTHTKPAHTLSSKPPFKIKEYSIGLLALVSVCCIIAFVFQMDKKNSALLEIDRLKLSQKNQSTEIQQLTASVETSKKNQRTLTNENNKLKSQLSEKNAEIKRLTSTFRSIRNSDNQSVLQDTRISSPRINNNLRMVLIPAGEFRMGSSATDQNAFRDERPEHSVYLDAFYIDIYEVTNSEYKKFIDSHQNWRKDLILRKYHDGKYLHHWNGNNYPIGKGNHPIVYVSWYAAMAYANWKGKRLPTEAEWEKAARGRMNNQSINLPQTSDVNYNFLVGSTTAVGKYASNPYGLYDLYGNVSEYCLDDYNGSFYTISPELNPISGGSINSIVKNYRNIVTGRVVRGGSWASSKNGIRVTFRIVTNSPDCTSPTIGFRCVKPVKHEPASNRLH